MAYLAVTLIQAGAAWVHLCNYVLLSLGQGGGGAVVLQTSHWIVQYCKEVLEEAHSKRGSFSKTFFAFWLCGPCQSQNWIKEIFSPYSTLAGW